MIEISKTAKNWIFGFFIFAFSLSIFLYETTNSQLDDDIIKFNNKYPIITTNDSINAEIIDISHVRGSIGVTFNDSSMFSFYPSVNYNYDAQITSLYDNCEINDKVIKRRGSDTIFIFRKNKMYFYIHFQAIYHK